MEIVLACLMIMVGSCVWAIILLVRREILRRRDNRQIAELHRRIRFHAMTIRLIADGRSAELNSNDPPENEQTPSSASR